MGAWSRGFVLAPRSDTPRFLPTASAPAKNPAPFRAFEFEYTSHRPATPTGFRYRFALEVPTDGSQPPVVDVTITARGPVACPTRSRLGAATASIWTGAGPLLHLDVAVFSTGHGVAVVLTSQGNVVAVIRGTLVAGTSR